MKFKQRMFALIDSRKIVAVIQAMDKQQARGRAHLISHLVKIPDGCRVKAVQRNTICRAPVFFEGHFLAIEDALAEA